MTYKIVDVEGIGPVYAEKLVAAGIDNTEKLLEKCSKPAGRKALEEETGISGKLILTWTNHCDLMRIDGEDDCSGSRASSSYGILNKNWVVKPLLSNPILLCRYS